MRFLPCSSAKKCRVCLFNLSFAVFLFILCYSLLYLVTICRYNGLISSRKSIKFCVVFQGQQDLTYSAGCAVVYHSTYNIYIQCFKSVH